MLEEGNNNNSILIRRVQSNNDGVKMFSARSISKYESMRGTSLDLSEGRERNDISYNVRFLVLLTFLYASFFFNVD